MSLIDTYDDHEFPEDAVSEMAATFDSKDAMILALGVEDAGRMEQMAQTWANVWIRHGITDAQRRLALVLQGMELHYEDAKERALASMAAELDHVEA